MKRLILVLCIFAVTTVFADAKNGSVIDNFTNLQLTDQHIEQTFKQTLPYTLKTTVKNEPDGTTYIVTGDIPAMWVRDSCAQIYPYVYMGKNDAALQRIISGTILRNVKHFNSAEKDAAFINSWQEDYTPHEYKLEPDGVAYVIRLAWLYWKITGDEQWAHKTDDFAAHQAFNNALDLLEKYTGESGMIKCTNRPSDDWTNYPYLIPTNMFLATMLPKLSEMYVKIWNDPERAKKCTAMSKRIRDGINAYGIYDHPILGKMWAYEVDGKGNVLLMDDANVPSLLSAPYLEFCTSRDPIYQNTLKYILSESDLFYFTGVYHDQVIGGIGSPHTDNSYVWPMSIIMQALTSDDDKEIALMLKYLNILDNNTYYVRESVNPNDPSQFTRSAFAWGNALYAELIIKKILGFNFYPDDGTLYLKPHLNPVCNKAELDDPVDFGGKSSMILQLSGNSSQIVSATINDKPAAIIDKDKGVKIPEGKASIVIRTL